MRLYKRHDADLLCLYSQKSFAMQKLIKKAVLSYLNNDSSKLNYPESTADLSDLPSTAQFHLYLSPKNKDDEKILACMSKIPAGFKNSFLKNITRYYLSSPTVFTFKNKVVTIKAERNSLAGENRYTS